MKTAVFPLGMTSVTFRRKSISEVASLAHDAGLSLIEWGADVHVPPADRTAIETARREMARYGITCPSYGTYYRLGESDPASFAAICETAVALGAGTVRTWLGTRGSAETTEAMRASLLEEASRLCDLAEKYRLTLAFEFHGKTCNDTGASSRAFLDALARENAKTYWQPLAFSDDTGNLRAVLPHLCAVHVFSWDDQYKRYPLASGAARWQSALSLLREAGCTVPLLLEFVRDDDERQFSEDAETLRRFAKAE